MRGTPGSPAAASTSRCSTRASRRWPASTTRGKVVNGPDLSFDSQNPDLAHLDTFGHGTHMAGIIAGHDTGSWVSGWAAEHGSFLGVAPDAAHRQREARRLLRRDRRVAGDRRYRLGRTARARQRHAHPGDQPVVRHERAAAGVDRPARVRGRGRVATRHRRRRLGRQQRGGRTGRAHRPRDRPVVDRGRCRRGPRYPDDGRRHDPRLLEPR